MTANALPFYISSINVTHLDDRTHYASAELTPILYSIYLHWQIPFVSDKYNAQILSKHLWQYKLPIEQDVLTQARQQRQRQRAGVRALLRYLLNDLAIVDTLNDSYFPYRLVNTGYYICFSHSGNSVAVALSKTCAVGIDIETHAVKWRVAQRFYHADDIRQLQILPMAQRAQASQWLWQIKESLIKIHQYTLAQGLGIYYPNLVAALIAASDKPTVPISFVLDSHTVRIVHTPSITVVYQSST